MKRVINGKTYNTDTATLIVEYNWTIEQPDLITDYPLDKLYITKKGNIFIFGESENLQSFARDYLRNEEYYGSRLLLIEDIFPLTKDEALSWCQIKNIDPEIIEKHFEIEEA